MDETTSRPTLCPECGRPDAGPVLPPRARRRRAMLFFLVTFAAIAAILTPIVRNTKPTGVSSGSMIPLLVEPAVTLAQVRAIAAAAPDQPHPPGALTRSLADVRSARNGIQPGIWALEVIFGTAAGARIDLDSWGWPTTLVTRVQTVNFENAATRKGFKPAVTDLAQRSMGVYESPRDPLRIPNRPRWQWQGQALLFQPPPEETGGIYTTVSIRPGALALPAALLIILWLLLPPCRAVIRRTSGRSLPRWSSPAIVLIGFLLFAGAAALSHQRTDGRMPYRAGKTQQVGPPGPIYWTDPNRGRLPTTHDAIRALTPSAETDRRLAGEILAAAHLEGRPEDSHLFAVSIGETQFDNSTTATGTYRFPLYNLMRSHYIRRPDFGAAEYLLPNRRLYVESAGRGRFSLWIVPKDASIPITELSLNTELAALIIVGASLLGLFATLPLRVLQSRRIRRRRREGRCIYCDYQAFSATTA